MDIEEIGKKIIGAAIKVHRALGPGLLESAYQTCLDYELRKTGLKVEREISLPIKYEDVKIDAGYRIDMLVEDCIIIENKTVEKLLPIHDPQLLTYLKMKNCKLGFLLNWHVTLMKDGIKRMVRAKDRTWERTADSGNPYQ
ncbi:MAG: GxxExxY protein [Candidatus Brocadia sp.]|nr:GxxExxY protein [Candidatus Brocadia sp.]